MINRNNYEEYFLLYVDNELDEAERSAVENFVKQNPDVATELKMLKQTSLIADDDIQFDHKKLLYKKEGCISLANYEGYFLLAIDNELTNKEAVELEEFLLKHPQLHTDFTLLKSTVLPCELIQFKDKSGLYRTEKKERKIPVIFMRVSVAASLIGVIATVWMLNRNDVSPQKQGFIVREQNIEIPSQKNIDIKVAGPVTHQPTAALHTRDNHVAKSSKGYVLQNKSVNNNINVRKPARPVKNGPQTFIDENELTLADTRKSLSEKKRPLEELPTANLNSNDVSTSENSLAKAIFTENKNAIEDRPIAKQAVYQEIENEEENNSIYIGAAEINKTKLKNLLRKAVNFFDRKNIDNNSDRIVQIASFQIKSK